MANFSRPITHHSDPQLRVPSIDFDFNEMLPMIDGRVDLCNITDAHSLAEALRNTIVDCKSIGLSAPQIGIRRRVIAVGNPHDRASIIVAFNPVITDESGDLVRYEEGCLSFPGLFLRLSRHAIIRVRYTTEVGVTDTIKLSGLTARAFLHEIDHLNGVLFVDRAGSCELTRARSKQKQLLRRMKAMAKRQPVPPMPKILATGGTASSAPNLAADGQSTVGRNTNGPAVSWKPEYDTSMAISQ